MLVTINEHSATRTCVNHGNVVNCPTTDCPGVPREHGAMAQHTGDGLRINREVRDRAIAAAVAEFERLTGLRCTVKVTDGR